MERLMRDARVIGALALSAVWLAGCDGDGQASEPTTTLDYVTVVRPLAYANARAACRGHSLTSLALEFDVEGRTIRAAAHDWARRNQRDARLRAAAYRGCRDGLAEAR